MTKNQKKTEGITYGKLTKFYLWLRRILKKDNYIIGIDYTNNRDYTCIFQKVGDKYCFIKTYDQKTIPKKQNQ